MQIIYTDEFVKRFNQLPDVIKKRALKQEILFKVNQFHPSLHIEKLIPKGKQLWSFRVDKKYRIIFSHSAGDVVVFLSVGVHDWIYKYTNRI